MVNSGDSEPLFDLSNSPNLNFLEALLQILASGDARMAANPAGTMDKLRLGREIDLRARMDKKRHR